MIMPDITSGFHKVASAGTTPGVTAQFGGDGPAARHGENAMAWVVLFIAGIMEIGWAVGLKFTEGFTRLKPTLVTLAVMTVSVALLAIAVRTLPLGTAYAVWTAIGTIGTVIFGIVFFGESVNAMRLVCIGLIVTGVIGLKLVTPSP